MSAAVPLVIYHGNCADGFAAAWAIWTLHTDWEFHAGKYQEPPPDVTGRDVILVDFSYKRPVLEAMAPHARTILILDHHKSAAEDLAGYPPPPHGGYDPAGWYEESLQTIYTVFDMQRSGAGITWDYFHPDEPRPALLNHVEDRDLWRFALSGTREIQAAVFSYPYEFAVWEDLMRGTERLDLMAEGMAIERKHHKDIAELLGVVTRTMTIGGHDVPVANLPYTLTSDAGHALAKGQPFAGCYWDTPAGRVFSLRSTPEGLDVSAIAAQYGGGGHRDASGFLVPWGHPLTDPCVTTAPVPA